MIAPRELVSVEALRRYDDNGEPVYTTTERILLALRWWDWVTATDLFDALEIDRSDHRTRWTYSMSLRRLTDRGRVECRDDRFYRLASVQPDVKQAKEPTCANCANPPEPGRSRCTPCRAIHRAREKARYHARRAA